MKVKVLPILLLLLFLLTFFIIYLNSDHENVLEESLALHKTRDSLSKIKIDTALIELSVEPPNKDKKEKGVIFEYKEGFAKAQYKGKFGFVNKQKVPITEFKYDLVDDFSEGLAAVCIDYKWGFINTRGKEIIELKYNYVMHFSEGIAGYKDGEKWGFINKSGKVLIAPMYETITPFKNGQTQVSIKNRKFFYINNKGKCVKDCK